MPGKPDLLQGTLDLMVLKTLGTQHGYGIALRIQQISGDLRPHARDLPARDFGRRPRPALPPTCHPRACCCRSWARVAGLALGYGSYSASSRHGTEHGSISPKRPNKAAVPRPARAGALAGLGGAYALSSFLTAYIFGIEPTDPWTMVATAGFLVLVAIIASLVPAWRLGRLDPARALRVD